MANIFSLTSSSYDGRYMTLYCKQEKNVSTNKSKITWTLTVTGGSSNYYGTGPTTVKINGSQVYYSGRKDWETKTFPAAKGSVSGSIMVDHDQYGDAKIEVSLSTAIYVYEVTTESGTWTLDNIARASQPSCITRPDTTEDVGYIGKTITIHMNRASSSFTHKAYYYFGELSGLIGENITSSVSWTIPMSLCSAIKTSYYGTGTIRVYTYTDNGSTYIGYKDVKFKAHVPEYTLKLDNTAVFLNNKNPVIKKWKVAVKGFTKLDWNTKAPQSQYYNYITNYFLCLIKNGDDFTPDDSLCKLTDTTATSGTTDYLTYTPGTYRVKMAIKDSRGKWANYVIRDLYDHSKPFKITIYDYSSPKIQNPKAFRCDENGTAKDDGTYLSLTCSGVVGSSIGDRNGISDILYQWRIVGGTYSGKSSIPETPISEFSVSNAFEIKFTITDTVGTETTTTVSIPIGKTDFNLTPYGAGFGMYHDSSKPNTLQSAWDLEINGGIVSDFIVERGSISSGRFTWEYEKMKSGVLKQWTVVAPTFSTWSDWGNSYWKTSDSVEITFGVPFLSGSYPIVNATNRSSSWAMPFIENVTYSKFNICGVRPNDGVTSENAYYYSVYAVGHWK